MTGKNDNKKKDPPKAGGSQLSILSFLTPALGILSAANNGLGNTNETRTPTELTPIMNSQPNDNGKKHPLEKEGEKISPLGTILNPPEPRLNSRNEVYEKVVAIMKGLAPIVTDKNAPTPNRKAFNALYQIVVFLSHEIF